MSEPVGARQAARRRFEYKFETVRVKVRQVTVHRCTNFTTCIYEYQYTYKTWLKNTYIQNIILVRSASICDRWFFAGFFYTICSHWYSPDRENLRRSQKSVNPVFYTFEFRTLKRSNFAGRLQNWISGKIPVLTLSLYSSQWQVSVWVEPRKIVSR